MIHKISTIFLIVCSIVLFTAAIKTQAASVTTSVDYTSVIEKAKSDYIKGNYTYIPYMQDYSPIGDYFKTSTKSYPSNVRLIYDNNGIPMVNYSGKYYYNPVTICNVAISEYGKYLNIQDDSHKKKFLHLADFLITQQSKDGAFHYTFDFPKPEFKTTMKKGWVSAMAQGSSLTIFSRAYLLTHKVKYLNAGKASLSFLLVPKSKNGVMTDLGDISSKLKKYIWFEEYVTKKNNYTLNGYMFTLFGIYDWSKLRTTMNKDYGQTIASILFWEGTASLKQVLRKYDLGGFTMYDLSHYTMNIPPHMVPSYHAIHIFQLRALYSITGDTYFKNTYIQWASYVPK